MVTRILLSTNVINFDDHCSGPVVVLLRRHSGKMVVPEGRRGLLEICGVGAKFEEKQAAKQQCLQYKKALPMLALRS
jgi:hypothetical protein